MESSKASWDSVCIVRWRIREERMGSRRKRAKDAHVTSVEQANEEPALQEGRKRGVHTSVYVNWK